MLLAERGWIKKHIRGWLLTPHGKAIGGEQHSSEQTAIPYVTWPETILDNPLFLQSIAQITGAHFQYSPKALSGHQISSAEELIVENWLYLAGINHARTYPLQASEEKISVDFFLPDVQVCIDIWGASDNAAALNAKLMKQEFYQKNNYDYIELHDETVLQIDEFLAKQLFGFGLTVY